MCPPIGDRERKPHGRGVGEGVALPAIAEVDVTRTRSGNEVAEIFKSEFVAAASASFAQWILVAAVVGGMLLAAGLVLRLVGGRRRVPAAGSR